MTTKTLNIYGQEFTVTQPFAEGHVLTPGEAKQLNQVRAENVRNNFASKIKEAVEAGDTAKLNEVREAFAKYDAEYVMTLSSVGTSRSTDPVEREARSLAREYLKAHLAKSGRSMTKTPEGETDESWKEKVAGEVDRIAATEQILKLAKRQVEQKAKNLSSLEESLSV